MSFYTYLHCEPDGTPFYVGKGHGDRAYCLYNRSAHHKAVVAKYGIRVLVFPCDSEEQAFADEVQQIAQLRGEGYVLCNVTDGGEGCSGRLVSEGTRSKISAARRGIKFSAEHKENLSTAHRGNKLSPEQIAKQAEGRRGTKRSPEALANMSAAQKGRRHSPETCAKISAALKGKPLSLETRAKMSASGLGRKFSAAHKAKISAAHKRRHAIAI